VTPKRWWLAAQIAFFAIAIWYFGRQVALDWDKVAALSVRVHVDWWFMAQSMLWVFASYAVLIATWRQTVVAWGQQLSWRDATRIWFISNLGRYVPGKVWQIGAMGALASEAGVSSTAAVGSSLVVNLINLVAACLVILLAGSRGLAPEGFAAALVVFSALAFASPWLLPWVVRFANRITGREIPEPKIPALAIVFAFTGCALAWNLYGIAFRDLAVALFGEAAGRTSSYTAVFTLSYLSGYLTLFAPGGIGVREGVLTTLLPAAQLASGASALLLVFVSRLWLTVLEAAPGLILLAVRRSVSPKSSLVPNGSQTDDSAGG
jgi:uncharacterized membrane protein YbhN (UPF0104 family)